jgi:hypothetical protein
VADDFTNYNWRKSRYADNPDMVVAAIFYPSSGAKDS